MQAFDFAYSFKHDITRASIFYCCFSLVFRARTTANDRSAWDLWVRVERVTALAGDGFPQMQR
jgi:hypothetical protein